MFIGVIEVVYASNVEDFAGPEEVVESEEALPSTSAQPPKQTYRPATDFKPKWAKTKRVAYDIHPVHEPLETEKQQRVIEAIGNANIIIITL